MKQGWMVACLAGLVVAGCDGKADEPAGISPKAAEAAGDKTLAEGIETEGQLQKLKELGCDGGQGYLFAPPLSFADLQVHLREHDQWALPTPSFDEVPSITTIQ